MLVCVLYGGFIFLHMICSIEEKVMTMKFHTLTNSYYPFNLHTLIHSPEPAEDDSSDDSSSSDDDELPPSPSRGKQLNRPTGRGKQLRAPSPQQQKKDDSDSSDSSDDEIVQPRGGGKQFGMNRGMGKQLPRPT